MDSFSQLLKNIQNSDPKTGIQHVWELFSSINHMNHKEILAAYQTLRFFEESVGEMDEQTKKQVAAIDRAIELRMIDIGTPRLGGSNHKEEDVYRERFRLATKYSFKGAWGY